MLYSLSTVWYSEYCSFVFLGRGLSVTNTESQEDQYLFDICLCAHCGHLHHQSGIFSVSNFPSHLTACFCYSVLYLLRRGLSLKKYRVLRYLEQPKLHHKWWTTVKVKKLPVTRKSDQALNKNKTKKSPTNHLRHKLFQTCSYLT